MEGGELGEPPEGVYVLVLRKSVDLEGRRVGGGLRGWNGEGHCLGWRFFEGFGRVLKNEWQFQ